MGRKKRQRNYCLSQFPERNDNIHPCLQREKFQSFAPLMGNPEHIELACCFSYQTHNCTSISTHWMFFPLQCFLTAEKKDFISWSWLITNLLLGINCLLHEVFSDVDNCGKGLHKWMAFRSPDNLSVWNNFLWTS